MLVPKINNIKNTNETNPKKIVLEVDETKKIIMESIHDEIFFNDKEFESYIKYIEKLVRNSLEYRSYIWTLKNEFNLNHCKFFSDIDIETTKVSLEFHHYPFTLYDIVLLTVVDKINRYGNIESGVTNSFKLAEEIVKLHYENKIGLVPLTKTVHKLVHNGSLFIPLTKQYVFGNYKIFFNNILNCEAKNDYIKKITSLEELTEDIISGKKNNDLTILDDLKVEIKMLDAELPQTIIKEERMAI